MKTQTLEYREDEKVLRGLLAWDDSRNEPQPGILVFHENTGLTEHERERAARLAQSGYVALACDMFGERAIPANDAERRAAFEEFAVRSSFRARSRVSKPWRPSPKWTGSRWRRLVFAWGDWWRWSWRAPALI